MSANTFNPGDPVEYDSHQKQARRNGCITYPSDELVVLRGTYMRLLDDRYSLVRVDGRQTLVRTRRLRPPRHAS